MSSLGPLLSRVLRRLTPILSERPLQAIYPLRGGHTRHLGALAHVTNIGLCMVTCKEKYSLACIFLLIPPPDRGILTHRGERMSSAYGVVSKNGTVVVTADSPLEAFASALKGGMAEECSAVIELTSDRVRRGSGVVEAARVEGE